MSNLDVPYFYECLNYTKPGPQLSRQQVGNVSGENAIARSH